MLLETIILNGVVMLLAQDKTEVEVRDSIKITDAVTGIDDDFICVLANLVLDQLSKERIQKYERDNLYKS